MYRVKHYSAEKPTPQIIIRRMIFQREDRDHSNRDRVPMQRDRNGNVGFFFVRDTGATPVTTPRVLSGEIESI